MPVFKSVSSHKAENHAPTVLIRQAMNHQEKPSHPKGLRELTVRTEKES